jgi:hypothetical protein
MLNTFQNTVRKRERIWENVWRQIDSRNLELKQISRPIEEEHILINSVLHGSYGGPLLTKTLA